MPALPASGLRAAFLYRQTVRIPPARRYNPRHHLLRNGTACETCKTGSDHV